MKKLYIGNLAYSTTQEELAEAFTPYASVQSVKIISDRDTGQSRGFGFVEFNDSQEADRAIEEMDGSSLGGKTLRVNEARPQTDARGGGGERRPRSGFSGGRGGGAGHGRY